MSDTEIEHPDRIEALSERLDRQYGTIRTLEGMLASQNIVIDSLLEHHELLATLGPEAAAISGELLTILRKQLAVTTDGLAAVATILKPDHDASVKRKLDGMVTAAFAHLRP